MSDLKLATVYSMALGDPKPLHSFVLLNWSLCKYINFILIVDNPDAWQKVMPENSENIMFITTTAPEFFEKSYKYLDVATADEFKKIYGQLFHLNAQPMNGWTACGLRPMLHTLFPQAHTPLWGWIDYDVLINAPGLHKHLSDYETYEMLLCPDKMGQWEQFKLFSHKLDLKNAYLQMTKDFVATGIAPNSPLEARLVYDLRAAAQHSVDKIEQAQVATHWAFSDKTPNLPNQYDVWVEKDMSLKGAEGQATLFFIADTQVKAYDQAQADEVRAQWDATGEYLFVYTPATYNAS